VTRWLTRSEAVWLLAIVVVSGAGLVLGVRHSYFYADDVTNLALAHGEGLTDDLLTTDYFGHLSPGHRFLDWLIALTRGSWAFSVGLVLAIWGGAVAAFYAVVRQIAGRGFLALAATAMFASSPVFVRTMQWPASGDLIIPATACTLAAVAAALHWHRTRARLALAIAWLGALGGVVFYEKPVLVLLYVVGIVFFVRAPSLGPRAVASPLRADALLLGGLVVIAVGYLIILKGFDYAPTPGHVTLTQWEQYLRATWTRGTTPLLIGQTIPVRSTRFTEDMVWVAQAVLALVVAWSVARRFSAWRAWAFYAVGWAVNVALVGYGRIEPFGVLVGLDPRYSAEIAYLLPLTLVLAFVRTEPDGAPVRGVAFVRRGEEATRAVVRRRPAVGYLALAPLAGLWIASCANAYARLADAWPGAGSRTVTERMLRGIDRVRAAGPASVLDGNLPFAIVAAGQGRISDWIHVLRPGFRFERPAGPFYVIHPSGAVTPARDVRGLYRKRLRGCLPAGHGFDVAPAKPFQGDQLVLQVRLADAGAGRVVVFIDNQGSGFPGLPQRTARIEPGQHALRLALGAGPLFRLRLTPAGAPVCAREVSVLGMR